MLCINCSESAPPALLSALLSPAAATSASSSSSSLSLPSHNAPETGLTTYDQKQSGKYNIHLNIKDVAIIALDAGGVDGGVGDFSDDYYEDYDVSDFTVKPIFGLIEITSDKPNATASASQLNSTTTARPLFHFEGDSDPALPNETGNAATSLIEEPIIKDPVVEPINKTQSVVILNDTENNDTSSSGIVVSTSTPTPEQLPPKLPLADLANVQSVSTSNASKATVVPALFPTKPNEIPVHVVLDSVPFQKISSRQRPNGNWRLKHRIRASPNHNRRITPPPMDNAHHLSAAAASALGNNQYRKGSLSHARRRNCVLNSNGHCQNSQRRFSSPTL